MNDERYTQTFSCLLENVKANKESMEKHHQKLLDSIGNVINVADNNFSKYAGMVHRNETCALKAIEALAVSLFSEKKNYQFELYPVKSCYAKMPVEEQAKSRPFQIIITDGEKKTGVAFGDENGRHYQEFSSGNYRINSLVIIRFVEPSDVAAHEALITLPNKMNKDRGLDLRYMTIREFWVSYFGEEEWRTLIEQISYFNERAREIIGFSTVVTPSESAIERFRAETGKMLQNRVYIDSIPDDVYYPQKKMMQQNYIEKGRWRAMIGTRDFAISFITSEWYYKMQQLTESFDLTWVAAGYLKSVEQLLFAVIGLSKGKEITIRAKDYSIVEYTEENESLINTTLGNLEAVVRNNSLLDVNKYARDYLVETISDWRDKKRNKYFHKERLISIEQLSEIRETAIQIYFLILGAFRIEEEELRMLGI